MQDLCARAHKSRVIGKGDKGQLANDANLAFGQLANNATKARSMYRWRASRPRAQRE
jgi:hypothetical protein